MRFTNSLADSICERIADGESLRSVCRDENMPALGTVFRWLNANDNFREQYARAKQIGLEALAEDLIDIADNANNDWMERFGKDDAGWVANGENIQRSKLRVDARKWILSKLVPKKYGDKLDLTAEHTGGITVEITRFGANPAA